MTSFYKEIKIRTSIFNKSIDWSVFLLLSIFCIASWIDFNGKLQKEYNFYC